MTFQADVPQRPFVRMGILFITRCAASCQRLPQQRGRQPWWTTISTKTQPTKLRRRWQRKSHFDKLCQMTTKAQQRTTSTPSILMLTVLTTLVALLLVHCCKIDTIEKTQLICKSIHALSLLCCRRCWRMECGSSGCVTFGCGYLSFAIKLIYFFVLGV